jgi:hypothetical protein
MIWELNKIYEIFNMLKNLVFLVVLSLLLFVSCGKEEEEESDVYSLEQQVEYVPEKDASIQFYNLKKMKEEAKNRFPCDTIDVIEFVLENFPQGTYPLIFDKSVPFEIQKPAVIYYNDRGGGKYVFCVISRSRQGERFIEPKNIIGYDQSYIDLDSKKLGTAFPYLILLECVDNKLSLVWEAPIPSHGGFNRFSIKNWDSKNIMYIENNFHYAQGVGHINYNYFLVDGIRTAPHLMMTYFGIDFKRSIANLNNDKYPDFYEYVFLSTNDKLRIIDSVAFVYNPKDSVYESSLGKRFNRPY